MARFALCLAVLACMAVAAAAYIPRSTKIYMPVTKQLVPGMRTFSDEIPVEDPSLPLATINKMLPSQIHIHSGGPDSMFIMWQTNNYTVARGAITPLDPNAFATYYVYYCTDAYNFNRKVKGEKRVYSQLFDASLLNGATALNYTSGILHHARLPNLIAGTRYYYVIGDGNSTSAGFLSDQYSFVQPQPAGPVYPQRLILVADLGTSYNSSATVNHMLLSAKEVSKSKSPPAVFYIGDFCYADTYLPNGTKTDNPSLTTPKTSYGEEGLGSSTYQPVWDQFQRLIQPLVSEYGMYGAVGNHEIEQQTLAPNPIFQSVQNRYKFDALAATNKFPGNFFFYSYEIGPTHNIFVSPYQDYTPGSAQWNFLYNDLRTVNRAVTPFVIMNMHHPWYSTDQYTYKEHEHMRVIFEPLTYKFGVDIFFYGHVHAYERTAPMNDYKIDPCGAVHITIGDGGNSEGSSFFRNQTAYNLNPTGDVSALIFEDLGCNNFTSANPGYMNPSSGNTMLPFPWYKRVFTFQADGNSSGFNNPKGFCYKEQPVWSQIREPSFGHGTLDVINSKTAVWKWRRNQDSNMVIADSVIITRDTKKCPNKATYMPYSASATMGLKNNPNF